MEIVHVVLLVKRDHKTSLLLVLSSFLPGGVLQEVSVHLVPGQLDVAHDAATDETVLDAQHVGILVGVGHTDICQLYIEVLINLQYRQLSQPTKSSSSLLLPSVKFHRWKDHF